MAEHSIILVGGPDSGKTNYLARLWKALQSGGSSLEAPNAPMDIVYVEDALAFLLKGHFAPRSEKSLEEAKGTFSLAVRRDDEPLIEIVVPDATGELWKEAVENSEIAPEWMAALKAASGALLFTRVQSDLNVAPLDWVNSEKLLRTPLGEISADEQGQLPTQVALCELLRFLEHTLTPGAPARRPRVAVLVTAWDRLDQETAKGGPSAFLRSQYPLFAGRLKEIGKLDVKAFGVSVVGGDLLDDAFRAGFLETELNATGYVVTDIDGSVECSPDLTLPVAWVVEGLLPKA